MDNIFLNVSFLTISYIVSTLIAILTALISPFLVLRKQALIADGLSHASFLGFILGGIITKNYSLYIALLITILISIFMKILINNAKISPDSAIGVVAVLGLSIGLIIFKKQDFIYSLESSMQGSILFIDKTDLIISSILACLLITYILLFYRSLFSLTFEITNAKLTNKHPLIHDYILTIFSACIIVIGVRLVGILLITALIIFPILISQRFKLNFSYTLILGVVFSVISINLGMFLSGVKVFETSPGPMIVVVFFLFLIFSIILNYIIFNIKKINKKNKKEFSKICFFKKI